jgi:hypothetical protein
MVGGSAIWQLSYPSAQSRLLHSLDIFTGQWEDSFYADPPVDHLDLWRFPKEFKAGTFPTQIWEEETRSRLTAAQF